MHQICPDKNPNVSLDRITAMEPIAHVWPHKHGTDTGGLFRTTSPNSLCVLTTVLWMVITRVILVIYGVSYSDETWPWESSCVYFLHVLDKEFSGSIFSRIVTRCIFWYGCLRHTVRAELRQQSTLKSITALRPVPHVLKESAPGFASSPLETLVTTAQRDVRLSSVHGWS